MRCVPAGWLLLRPAFMFFLAGMSLLHNSLRSRQPTPQNKVP